MHAADGKRADRHFEFRLALERFHRFENSFERIAAALKLATAAHSGQVRRSGTPYLMHPVLVATMLRERAAPIDLIVAGLVHDIVEDTTVSAEELESVVGSGVMRVVEAAGHAELGRSLVLSDADRVRRLVRLFQRPGVAELHACNRMVALRTALDGLHDSKREAFVRDTRQIVVPAIRVAGFDGLADELLHTSETPSETIQLPFDDLVQALVPHDFGHFTRMVGETAARLELVSPIAEVDVLQRLDRLERLLREEKAPTLKDLLGDVAFIDLKGVWTWAEYLIRRGRRSRQVVDAIDQEDDDRLRTMDKTTGGILDCLIAWGTAKTDADTRKLHYVVRLIRRLRAR